MRCRANGAKKQRRQLALRTGWLELSNCTTKDGETREECYSARNAHKEVIMNNSFMNYLLGSWQAMVPDTVPSFHVPSKRASKGLPFTKSAKQKRRARKLQRLARRRNR